MSVWPRLLVITCLMALPLWGAIAADEAEARLAPLRTAFCPAVETPPVIDGKLDDACWKQADVQTHLFLHAKATQARSQTEALCVRDGAALYFAFRCHLMELSRAASRAVERDGAVWQDECVELFLLPAETPAGKVRFQFVVNSKGTLYDARSDRPAKAWNANLKAAVGTVPTEGRAGYWAAELAIPLADLGVTPKTGDVWRVNFARTSSDLGELSTWMPVLDEALDQPDRYGRLLLRRPTAGDLAQQAAYVNAVASEAPVAGPVETAIRIPDTPVVLRKAPVSDCRVLRAFAGDPVDGTLRSMPYSGTAPCEYPARGVGAGVSYHYNKNDGLHVTLADDQGFDVVVLRRLAQTEMYADATRVDGPGTGRLLYTFSGADGEVAQLPETAKTRRVSFFKTRGGAIADVAFYRLGKPDSLGEAETWSAGDEPLALPAPASKFDVGSTAYGMEDRYAKEERRALPLKPGPGQKPLAPDKSGVLHFVSEPFTAERGLAAVGFEARSTGAKAPAQVTFVVQDPLNPRRDLAWLRFAVPESGVLRPVVDFPDQVLLKGSRLWLTLICDPPAQLAGPAGGAPEFRLYFTKREQALPEALAYRKFLMRTLFGPVSEPRPWGLFRRPITTREEFFAQVPFADRCAELFLTIDQCTALDPADDLTRQYREWVFHRQMEKMTPVPPPPAPPGVPAWAWYSRLGWLEARRMVEWWMEERLVPTGEVGVGGIQDDGDLYQQFADIPFFETGGVAAKVLDGAARIAELAERDHLKGGINARATDALHAYEEGINHLALMARWFYGDPIYLERCMESARNVEKLTIVTPDGRRHFRSYQRMGYDDVLRPSEPAVDGSSAPLMWHTALQTADYNRNPQALKVLREWADTWLKLMKPPEWAEAVQVQTGKVVGSSKDQPLGGGYSSQAVTFVWLYGLTGDQRYIEPFLHYYRRGEAPGPSGRFLANVFALGGLDDLDARTLEKLAGLAPDAALALKGDPQPLQGAIVGRTDYSSASIDSLCDARRFPDMYTTAHQYTDRVLLGSLQSWPAVSYLGGHTKRNRYHPTHAVSWEGLGDEFGALVTKNRRDGLKVLLYNLSATARTGGFRVWALDHGEYRVTIGRDDDEDGKIDRVASELTRELVRADRVSLTLAPRAVTVIEITQVRKLDPIHTRADLAVAAREVALSGDTLTGTAHNIGASDVPDAQVAVVDAHGKVVAHQSLGKLEAPLDLVARRKPFSLRLPAGPRVGWRLLLDPDGLVPEIFEGNNEVKLDDLPAVDYRQGWE